jgi:hypothetical protein
MKQISPLISAIIDTEDTETSRYCIGVRGPSPLKIEATTEPREIRASDRRRIWEKYEAF